jgi:flagellar secretion chaperone FliS
MSALPQNHYDDVSSQSAISGADSRDLILMMYDAAIESINKARYHISRKEHKAFADANTRAMKIVLGLKGTLNIDSGGSVAQHLSEFYSYTLRNLVRAGSSQSDLVLSEAADLLGQVREAWATINPVGEQQLRRRLINVIA